MSITSALQLSMALLFSIDALANDAAVPGASGAALDKPVSIECTEVELEYNVGGAMRSTKSQDCAEKPGPVDTGEHSNSRNKSAGVVRR